MLPEILWARVAQLYQNVLYPRIGPQLRAQARVKRRAADRFRLTGLSVGSQNRPRKTYRVFGILFTATRTARDEGPESGFSPPADAGRGGPQG